jgi:GNAT superfamily N-acetyltransferase
MRIVLLKDLPDWRSHLPRVDEIFFTSSAVQSFTDAHRARFKARWLGRYLDNYLSSFFVALDSLFPPPERGRVGWGSARDPEKWEPVFGQDHAQKETVIGYLAGCLDDPTKTPLFADLGYYQAFAPLCADYPAHLHINVAGAARSKGVGAALIEAFAAQCKDAKLPGLHLVTNEGARNVRFYEQNGFRVLATTLSHNTPVVFMGRQSS